MLMGTDPLRNSEELWDELYTRTAMNGRRGMVIHAMGKYLGFYCTAPKLARVVAGTYQTFPVPRNIPRNVPLFLVSSVFPYSKGEEGR